MLAVRKIKMNKIIAAVALMQARQLARTFDSVRCDSVRADADKWITVHPHGGTGTPALIGEEGAVKGDMGGKLGK